MNRLQPSGPDPSNRPTQTNNTVVRRTVSARSETFQTAFSFYVIFFQRLITVSEQDKWRLRAVRGVVRLSPVINKCGQLTESIPSYSQCALSKWINWLCKASKFRLMTEMSGFLTGILIRRGIRRPISAREYGDRPTVAVNFICIFYI